MAPLQGDLAEALAEWWNPLLELADTIGPGVGGPCSSRSVRRGSSSTSPPGTCVAGSARSATIGSRWRRARRGARRQHETDWVNSLFLSLRFRAARRGAYNEFIYTFFKCLAPERLSYADGWYAEKEEPDDLVQIGDFMVQRRCPHLKADLARFGEVDHGILQCAMHGWRFDLATGTCLTSCDHEIVSVPVDESQR